MNKTIINAIAVGIQAQQPTLLVGEPGCGKTESVYSIGRSLGRHVRVILAHIYSQEDIGGFPAPDFDRGFVRMLPNEALFAGLKDLDIIFWDETNQPDEHKQGALMRVVHENRAGVHVLPKVSHIGAMNPPEKSAGGSEIAPPFANRFMWIDWKADTRVWCENAIKGFPDLEVTRLGEEWELLVGPQLSLVVAYGRARQDVLQKYPKTHSEACGPWPSLRSWTKLARIDAAIQSAGLDDDVRLVCFSGLVGNATATEYLTYLRELDLPDVEQLLLTPGKFKLPSRGDQRFAVLASVTSAVVRHFTDDRYHAAWKIFDTARAGGAGDIAVASATSLAAMHKHLKGPGPRKEMEGFLPLLKKTGIIPA